MALAGEKAHKANYATWRSMMSDDDDPPCSCVIDTGGLHDVANATGNIRTVTLHMLKQGVIAVPTWAWRELREAYPEDARQLDPYVTRRISTNRSITVRAARIAETRNSGFPRGPYDNHTVLLTAAVATNNKYRVITAKPDLSMYQDMGCDVRDLETWVSELD